MDSLREIVKGKQGTILDVRSPQEYAEYHIEGAINIPVHEIRLHLDKIDAMSKPIVVYCLSGGRSMAAAGLLTQAGIKEVFNAGGIRDMMVLAS